MDYLLYFAQTWRFETDLDFWINYDNEQENVFTNGSLRLRPRPA